MNRQTSQSGTKSTAAGSKKWVHPPDALTRGHIVYNVKFLGNVETMEPKGSDVVKEAVRKMKFNKQIKKAEGQKPPKVELTISVDGVTVQEPKYKVMQHQYPLHRISYCADDKNDKRIFTFIAKDPDSNQHRCFVFDSDKCAEEITLTIGQAFDLAYKKFLDTSFKDMDLRKQHLLMQKKVNQLTEENLHLKARVADLERLIDPHKLEELDKRTKQDHEVDSPSITTSLSCPLLKSPCTPPSSPVPPPVFKSPETTKPASPTSDPNSPVSPAFSNSPPSSPTARLMTKSDTPFLKNLHFHIPLIPLPKRSGRQKSRKKEESGAVPYQSISPTENAMAPDVGRKLENLVFEDNFIDTNMAMNGAKVTNGTHKNDTSYHRATDQPPTLAPPPPVPPRQNSISSPAPRQHGGVDAFGQAPFNPASPKPSDVDSFGMDSFTPRELDKQIQRVDRELLDLQTGFSQGLSFGPDDFTLADLDPLNKK